MTDLVEAAIDKLTNKTTLDRMPTYHSSTPSTQTRSRSLSIQEEGGLQEE